MSKPRVVTCADCGRLVDHLELFPKDRCLDCHDAAPEVRAALAGMTAERLADMWGADVLRGRR